MDFIKLRNIIFFSLLALITVYFLYIIRVFFYPVFWAAIIASIFYPLYKKITAKIKSPNLSAVFTLIIVLLVIVIPLALVGGVIVKQTMDLYGGLQDNQGHIVSGLTDFLNQLKNSFAGRLHIDQSFWVQRISDASQALGNFIFNLVKSFTQNSVVFLVLFIIMFYTLYFFLRDGEKFLKKAMYLSPIGDKNELMLYKNFTSTARAAIKGTLVIGLVQGALATIVFIITGVHGAVVWGLLTMFTSIIPALGSYVVWLPAAAFMLFTGHVWQGVTILLSGTLLIGVIDNILRPILVGKDSQLHPLLILFATLGGLVAFGISGFVIGPVLVALLVSFWKMYEHQYRKELEKNG